MSQKQRIKNVIQAVVFLLLLAVLDLSVFALTGRGIPCIFRFVTGFECPGCGMTRAAISLLSGEVSKALEYNKLCLSVMPATGLYVFFRIAKYIKTGSDNFEAWEYFLLILLLAVTVGYGIIRNPQCYLCLHGIFQRFFAGNYYFIS